MNKIRVAFADNHIAVLESISLYLDREPDITVILKVENGMELVKALEESESGLPDICLLDIRMPVLDGFETGKIIRKRWPAVKIIIFSGFFYKGYLEKMIQIGVESYLSKDIHPKEIIRAIRIVNEEGVYYNRSFNLELLKRYKSSPSSFRQLSELEVRLLYFILNGMTYSEIGVEMNKTYKSIEAIRSKLFYKMNVRNKVELVFKVLRSGYVDINDEKIN